ncbi:hypothetical protein GCM10010470_05740 [Saccharopolyspora taberi]|uniref:Uncharacterized protein n=1 Tax=Saccharopolyspora taberi TaxID=60895 RepID=A0ABN3V3A3_9PSEU
MRPISAYTPKTARPSGDPARRRTKVSASSPRSRARVTAAGNLQRRHRFDQRLDHQVVLARPAPVDGRPADTRPAGDRLDGQLRVPALGQQLGFFLAWLANDAEEWFTMASVALGAARLITQARGTRARS